MTVLYSKFYALYEIHILDAREGMSRPLITIAIPTYNRSEYLKRSLETILEQTSVVDPDENIIEIIISDNCSTDETQAVVERYLAAHPSIKFQVNETNIGPDGNFLKFVSLSSGVFTILIGDDDLLLPRALEHIVAVTSKNTDASVIFINGYKTSSKEFENTKERLVFKYPSQVTYFDDPYELYNSLTVGALTYMSVMLFNTDLLRSLPNLDDGQGTHFIQTVWVLKLLKFYPRSVIYPYPCVMQGYAETRVFDELKDNGDLSGKKEGDIITLVLLQFYSEHLPAISSGLGYNSSIARRLLSESIVQYSKTILYHKIKGDFNDPPDKNLIYKYTKRVPISWLFLYPILTIPASLFRPFKKLLLKIIFNFIN